MSHTIELVQDDHRPIVTLTVLDQANDDAPMDLSAPGTVVYVYFRKKGEAATLAKITCVNVTNGSDGRVRFQFPPGTLDVALGAYEGQISIDFNGEIQTVPERMNFRVIERFAEPA